VKDLGLLIFFIATSCLSTLCLISPEIFASFSIDDLYLFFQKVLTDRDSEHGDSDQDISANGSPMTRKRGM
jgi:hypothetical protein